MRSDVSVTQEHEYNVKRLLWWSRKATRSPRENTLLSETDDIFHIKSYHIPCACWDHMYFYKTLKNVKKYSVCVLHILSDLVTSLTQLTLFFHAFSGKCDIWGENQGYENKWVFFNVSINSTLKETSTIKQHHPQTTLQLFHNKQFTLHYFDTFVTMLKSLQHILYKRPYLIFNFWLDPIVIFWQ